MIFKRLILYFIATFLVINISAQMFEGGFIGGLSASQIDGDTQKDYKKPGFYAGVFVETDFTQVIGAKIELYYIGKGAKKKIDDFEEFNTTLRYVDMPFLLTIKPFDRAELDIGVALSYLINSKYVTLGNTIPGGVDGMHHFDFGAMASASYYFTDNLAFNVRVEYSMVPVKNYPNWFNNNLSFGLVYKIL
ncbi:MAG: porin family protein [Bacteroidales bacterium]|nr:porin family protein [Bacteroidales bacterium]